MIREDASVFLECVGPARHGCHALDISTLQSVGRDDIWSAPKSPMRSRRSGSQSQPSFEIGVCGELEDKKNDR